MSSTSSLLQFDSISLKKEINVIRSDVMVAIVEQGLLPLLECIALGVCIETRLNQMLELQSVAVMSSSEFPRSIDTTQAEWQQIYCDPNYSRNDDPLSAALLSSSLNYDKLKSSIDSNSNHDDSLIHDNNPLNRFPEPVVRTLMSNILTLITEKFKSSLQNQFENSIHAADGEAETSSVVDISTTTTVINSSQMQDHVNKKTSTTRSSSSSSSLSSNPAPAPGDTTSTISLLKSKKTSTLAKESSSSTSIFNRILFALLLSGNIKLRINVFIGILFISARDDDFGRFVRSYYLLCLFCLVCIDFSNLLLFNMF